MTTQDRMSLTERQVEFLSAFGRGMRIPAIAGEYELTVQAVETTLKRARERYAVGTTVEALVIAIAREEIGLTHDGVCYTPAATVVRSAA